MTDDAYRARLLYRREYARKNRQKLNLYQREWRARNPERVKAYQRDYWMRKGQQMEKRKGITMNCTMFKENVKRITRDAISKGLRLSGDLEEIQEKEYDPDLSETGKAKWREQAKAKQAEINSCFEKMMSEIRAQADDLIAFAEETQVLQGAKLTDDARLFTDGIPLTADDLRQIIARSAGNHTMLQLAENYRLKYFANDRSLPVYRSIKTQIISLANRTVDDCQFLAHFPQKQYVQEQFMNAINQTLDQLPENDGH